MNTSLRKLKVGLTQPIPTLARVGARDRTIPIEPYLRRAYDVFSNPKVGKDVVVLLERFFFYKLGHDGNALSSAENAIHAVCDFIIFTKSPPWLWTSNMLYEFLADMKLRDLAAATIRGKHYYIKSMCESTLSDRDIINKITARHENCTFQQIVDKKSRALVKGFAKRKKKLNNPRPDEMQMVYDHIAAEFEEACETGGKIPYCLLRDRAIIAMFDGYGLRLTELIQVNVSDFDYNALTPGYKNLGLLHVIGKGSKLRHLPILEAWIYPVLKAYIEQVRPYWTDNLKTPDKDKDALFFSNCGKRLSPSAVQGIINKRFHNAGVTRRFSPHRLRSSAITRIADQLGLKVASTCAGHSFAATTDGYYDIRASASGDALSNHVKALYESQ